MERLVLVFEEGKPNQGQWAAAYSNVPVELCSSANCKICDLSQGQVLKDSASRAKLPLMVSLEAPVRRPSGRVYIAHLLLVLDKVKAKITGSLRDDWNDPTAHLSLLDRTLLTPPDKEAIGIPYYWQRVVNRPRVQRYFYERRYVYRVDGGREEPLRQIKRWLLTNRFFRLYKNQSLDALYVLVEREPGHHHFVCAEYDDLFIEAYDVMRVIYNLSPKLILIKSREKLVEFLKVERQKEWLEISDAIRLSAPAEEYLDLHFIRLVDQLHRDGERYFW